MPHFRQGIADLPPICYELGMRYIVISPGSRNVPLVKSFARFGKITIISVIDERSAGYVALGIGLSSKTPVGVVCTSGTASLNYYPAVAEAFYQKVPLLVITADRPSEWVDQGDGQTIRQQHVFSNHILSSFQLPVDTDNEDDYWFFSRSVSEAINTSVDKKGPVHVNVPLREPIYTELPDVSEEIPAIKLTRIHGDKIQVSAEIKENWVAAKRTIVVCGYHQPDKELQQVLQQLSNLPTVVVFAENLANSHGDSIIPNHDVVISGIPGEEASELHPDLVIHLGGNVLSKRLKLWLRAAKPKAIWRLTSETDFIDTFQGLSHTIVCEQPSFFLDALAKEKTFVTSGFNADWMKISQLANDRLTSYVSQVGFSDLYVMHTLHKHLPNKLNLHLGNSTPVRYFQLFNSLPGIHYYSNRGTSGIDGCISTMAGVARADKQLSLLVIGDVAFHYDTNGLALLSQLPNVRILVVNNGGGDIFRVIEKDKHNNGFEELLTTPPTTSIKKMTEANSLSYYFADDISTFTSQLTDFFEQSNTASVFEVDTSKQDNASIFKNLFRTNS